ncbi:sensor histidine kinase [Paracraurococcus lichenis]|uniref:histidine kinase n=1 Tax=Paracraurococcus lichenis TaxID=3064888 RepID=A0ABT9EDL6_9PROT|nr:HWE histidine kinase domain-containing protein [Paracraurococcus sp. LOR1-02]MDO9714317.1 HWE histidine kinase domain-containing protein [Paracraurococcus sp. LOR1-02]
MSDGPADDAAVTAAKRCANLASKRVPPSLAQRLSLLVAAVALPLLALATIAVWRGQSEARVRADGTLLGRARALALAVEREFDRAEALLDGLAASSALARGDLDAFEGEMRAASARFGGAIVTLVAIDGRMALMTSWAPGERRAGIRAPDAAQRVLASGRAEITDLFRGAMTGTPAVAVGVPVLGPPDGSGRRAVVATIGLTLPQERLAAALETQRVPDAPGWVGVVADRVGTIVARTRAGSGIVGQPMRPEMLSRVAVIPEGVLHNTTTREGIPATIAFAHGPQSGYIFILTMPEAEFEAPLRAALARILISGVLVATAGIALAVLLARRTVAAFRRLTGLVAGGTAPGPTGLREADDLAAAFAAALGERARSERHRRLVVAELNHRVKNVLATVQALTSQTLRGPGSADPARFAADLNGRLRALARAHDLLTAASWEATDLDAVVRAALAPWLGGGDPERRIDLSCDLGDGQAARLSPTQAQTLTLALHELATNAAKHGALSTFGGRIAVACHREPGGGVGLEWVESGGPPVGGTPARRGFGTRLLEQALARDLGAGATVQLRFEPDGLQATVRFAPHVAVPRLESRAEAKNFA